MKARTIDDDCPQCADEYLDPNHHGSRQDAIREAAEVAREILVNWARTLPRGCPELQDGSVSMDEIVFDLEHDLLRLYRFGHSSRPD